MAQQPFVDYYEALQLSPRASSETIDRVYRLLAKRYHPDNQTSGDDDQFQRVQQAHDVLSNPERRTSYDVKYDEAQNVQWKIFDQSSATDVREQDRRVLHAILSLLYIERRRRPVNGGLGPIMLERALAVAEEHLEFPIWYMKQHGWIEVLGSGQLAITVKGIDKLADKDIALRENRLLSDSSLVRQARDENHSGPQSLERIAG